MSKHIFAKCLTIQSRQTTTIVMKQQKNWWMQMPWMTWSLYSPPFPLHLSPRQGHQARDKSWKIKSNLLKWISLNSSLSFAFNTCLEWAGVGVFSEKENLPHLFVVPACSSSNRKIFFCFSSWNVNFIYRFYEAENCKKQVWINKVREVLKVGTCTTYRRQ